MQEADPLRWMSIILLFDQYPEAIFWVALEAARSHVDAPVCYISTRS